MPFSNANLITPEYDLLRQQQRAMENAQTITLNDGTQVNWGDWSANRIQPPPSAPTPIIPPIQPPGQTLNPITPPVAQQQSVPGVPQLNQNQIPMPGQLGSVARQSVLAQNNLFGDNWSSMF